MHACSDINVIFTINYVDNERHKLIRSETLTEVILANENLAAK